MDGRDPDYQKLAVKGLIGSSKRVLSGTKNEDKIKAIKEGIAILEDFLDKFDKENRSKLNMAYLPLNLITALPITKNKLAAEFVDVYGNKRVKGNYKHLRTLYPEDNDDDTWDIVRNRALITIKENISKNNTKLFGEDGTPSEEHFQMIYWAFSPQPDKVKSYIDKLKPKVDKRKSNDVSSSDSNSDSDDKSAAKKRKSK